MVTAGIYLYRSDTLKNVLNEVDFVDKKKLVFIKPKTVTKECLEPALYGRKFPLNDIIEQLKSYSLDTRTCIVVDVPKDISDADLSAVCKKTSEIVNRFKVRAIIAVKSKYLRFTWGAVQSAEVDLMKSSSKWVTSYSMLFD